MLGSMAGGRMREMAQGKPKSLPLLMARCAAIGMVALEYDDIGEIAFATLTSRQAQ